MSSPRRTKLLGHDAELIEGAWLAQGHQRVLGDANDAGQVATVEIDVAREGDVLQVTATLRPAAT